VLTHIVRSELRQIKFRIELGKGCLGAPCAVAREGGVVAESPLLVLIVKLDEPRQHGQALGLRQPILDVIDVAVVDALRDDFVGGSLNRGQIYDLRQLLVGLVRLLNVLLCVERRFLFCRYRRWSRSPAGGRLRCWVAPLLLGGLCCGTA